MKWRKLVAIGCVAVMTVSMVTGCGGNTSEESANIQESVTATEEQVVSGADDAQNSTIFVQVTAVEGDKITAEVGTYEAPSMGEKPEGEAPEGMPEGEAQEGMPEGEAPSGEKPNGEAPSGEKPEGAPEKPEGEASEAVASTESEEMSIEQGEAPSGEKPDGEAPSGEKPEKAPEKPEGMPDGEAPSGEKPEGMPGAGSFVSSGEIIEFTLTENTVITLEYMQGSGEGTAEEIVLGSVSEITLDEENNATTIIVKNLNTGNGFGGSSEVTNGTAANTIDTESEVNGETYTSTGDDENALRVDGVTASLTDITVEKTEGESSNTEDGDFYGQNAGLLALNGAQVTITGATVNTSVVNGNGVFSYGEGTVVNISDSTIRTTENNSGGIQTTGGGTTNATNLDVETQGNSAAAIRSDRGGGTVNVDGGTYVTNGTGSPAVYCTADISVNNAKLTANASEGVVVEGKNSVSLTDCTVIGNMDHTYTDDSEENLHCIMIYQSMSGDAEVGDAYFSAEGGSITSQSGDMFYITNTDCEISLKDVVFTLANDVFLRVEGNSSSRGWGTEGANGGDVILTADTQTMEGNILVDEISTLNLTMQNNSNFTGAINPSGTGGTVAVTMDDSSAWTLTADSYITSFDGDTSKIDANGYHLYVNGEEVL